VAVSKEAASFILGMTGGAGVFLRAEYLSGACWQIIVGRGDGYPHKGFLLFSLSATNLRYWQSLGFHPPKRRPWRWAATPSVAPPCGSASIFGKWRIKGNKGNPLCEQPSPLILIHLPTSQSGRPPEHPNPSWV